MSNVSQQEALLALSLAPGLGSQALAVLQAKFGDAANICAQSQATLRNAGLSEASAAAIKNPDADMLAAGNRWLEHSNHHLLAADHHDYPPLLSAVHGAPFALFVAGDPAVLSLPQIAIVGSRNATAGGLETAAMFSAHLAQAGLTITSGLADGIDTAAHTAALKAGGQTIAVCGTGLDIVYPRRNRELAEKIIQNGALVSEFPPGTPPQKNHFPRRNRVISALTLGTLVVEAGRSSGALITARYATEQGREVFAIPGSIHSPQSKGCHKLIRDGAKLVETAGHIVEELASIARGMLDSLELQESFAAGETENKTETYESSADDPAHYELMSAMGWGPVTIDTLSERTGLTAAELSSMLLIMELENEVESLSGGRYQRLKRSHGGKQG